MNSQKDKCNEWKRSSMSMGKTEDLERDEISTNLDIFAAVFLMQDGSGLIDARLSDTLATREIHGEHVIAAAQQRGQFGWLEQQPLFHVFHSLTYGQRERAPK